jgi:hypothetical protein
MTASPRRSPTPRSVLLSRCRTGVMELSHDGGRRGVIQASKPEDWDDEEDGEWEAPLIDNPEYAGEWKPKMIANPDYKGEWVHPMIPNPDYKADPKLYLRAVDSSYVGFELWQVLSGTLFDDIIITDSMEEANAFAKETFYKKKDAEKAMFEKVRDVPCPWSARPAGAGGGGSPGVMRGAWGLQKEEEKREKERIEREEAVRLNHAFVPTSSSCSLSVSVTTDEEGGGGEEGEGG